MNRSVIVGRLTADPQLQTTPNGIATTRITVAVNRMPNANGERVADFINVVIWRKLAENVAKFCAKGSLVGIEGRIQSRSYDTQNGSKRYVTEVIADNVTFLGSKSSSQPQTQTQPQVQAVQTVEQVQAVVEEDPFQSFNEENNLDDFELPF